MATRVRATGEIHVQITATREPRRRALSQRVLRRKGARSIAKRARGKRAPKRAQRIEKRRADEQRARTGATLCHRPRTFTCKSRRTANGGAANVCDVICDEWRRAPQGASRRDPREGRSRVPVDEWRHPFGRDKSKPHEAPAKCSPCGRILTREANEQELG